MDQECLKDSYYTKPLVQLSHEIFQENCHYFHQHTYFHVHCELLDEKKKP
jgi:hypothetical protein